MRRPRPRYRSPFFFDRTVPRELYFSVQNRLNRLGYGAVWQPRSAVSRARNIEEIAEYCIARGIRVLATFHRTLELPEKYGKRLVLLRLSPGRKKTVNKILASLFLSLRRLDTSSGEDFAAGGLGAGRQQQRNSP